MISKWLDTSPKYIELAESNWNQLQRARLIGGQYWSVVCLILPDMQLGWLNARLRILELASLASDTSSANPNAGDNVFNELWSEPANSSSLNELELNDVGRTLESLDSRRRLLWVAERWNQEINANNQKCWACFELDYFSSVSFPRASQCMYI